ncbi:hypothetical protein BRM3_09015 [Brachybacterium huguangmaarense]|uniref:Uncharacterized protein n=1 Tax=Brachybacterium huguangmaarense TaxID=1652028 RepID=A0ABY6FXZ8_9MICO|nr:hypothetical protein [Brachybacterium huguangmaarense]UYG15785.1 hypothetical protein BRM3_09015 [Brachybacterium huguangmaarense]
MESTLSLWIAVGSFALAFAALLAVLWQIARENATRPTDGMIVARYEIASTETHTDMGVAISLLGPAIAYEAQLVVWGGATLGDVPAAVRRFTADSEPLTAIVRVPHGVTVRVGLAYLDNGLLSRRGVVRCSRRDVMGGPDSYQVWHWSWWQGLPRKGAVATRGRWKGIDGSYVPSRMALPTTERPATTVVALPPEYEAGE